MQVGLRKSEKLMASAIRSCAVGRWNAYNISMAESEDANFGGTFWVSSGGSTVFSMGFLEPCASSGATKKTYQRRRRPPKSKRKPRPLLGSDQAAGVLWDKAAGKRVEGSKKRKIETKVGELLVLAKSKTPKVIPREGSPSL